MTDVSLCIGIRMCRIYMTHPYRWPQIRNEFSERNKLEIVNNVEICIRCFDLARHFRQLIQEVTLVFFSYFPRFSPLQHIDEMSGKIVGCGVQRHYAPCMLNPKFFHKRNKHLQNLRYPSALSRSIKVADV